MATQDTPEATHPEDPEWGTIERACKEVGGDRPIHPSSYYRGAKAGYYEPPDRLGPNISRVNIPRLRKRLAAAIAARESAA